MQHLKFLNCDLEATLQLLEPKGIGRPAQHSEYIARCSTPAIEQLAWPEN